MNENKRAADDVITIRARILEMRGNGPRRKGTSTDHCGHCPLEENENCNLGCKGEAIKQGWYTPETFGD